MSRSRVESVWQRQPGRGRYAHPERERRLLLAEQPPGLTDSVEIEDRYIDGTRLRLRRITGGGAVVHKLAQKVRADADDPSSVMLTNIYLDAVEYERLLVLPAAELRKTRFSLSVGEVRFAIDVLRDQLEGLVLAEYELDIFPSDGQLALDYVADVTHDDRFSGGQLARTNADALRSLLTALGLRAG